MNIQNIIWSDEGGEMGGTRSDSGRDNKCTQRFSRKIWKEETRKRKDAMGWKDVDWIQVALDRIHWLAFAKTVMNILTFNKAGICLTNEWLFVAHEWDYLVTSTHFQARYV